MVNTLEFGLELTKGISMQTPSRPSFRFCTVIAAVTAILILMPSGAFAQSPWEIAVRNLSDSFQGPIARGLSLVSIVVGGLVYAFDAGESKRIIAGLLFGCGMALGAASFMSWLFQ
jgi:type IV secretory pathway VirB2 component (pilin)